MIKNSNVLFSKTIWWIFFISIRIDVYDDTNNLSKFQKNWLNSVDFIA